MIDKTKEAFNWKSSKRNKKELNTCVHMLFSGALVVSANSVSAVQPDFNSANNGTTVTQTATETTITQNQHYTNIYWNSFDTSAEQTVTFNQHHDHDVAINRISGGKTTFAGTLNANGKVVLINQNGFLFDNGSAINAASFMASANPGASMSWHGDLTLHNIRNHKANRYASIINKGTITITKNGGVAALVAPYVENSGLITNAPGVKGAKVYLQSINIDGAEGYVVPDGPQGVVQTAEGRIQAESGFVALVNKIYDASVNVGGEINADRFANTFNGGTVLVDSRGGIEFNDASISMDGGHRVRFDAKAYGDITGNFTEFNVAGYGPCRVDVDVNFRSFGMMDLAGDMYISGRVYQVGEHDYSRKKSDVDVEFHASGDLFHDGIIDIDSWADASGYGGSATAYADLEMFGGYDGGEWGNGSLVQEGDVTVLARADSAGYYATAEAGAFMIAGGDVTIDTDPVLVNSKANTEYTNTYEYDGGEYGQPYIYEYPNYSSANAESVLITAAGMSTVENYGYGQFGMDDNVPTFELAENATGYDLNIIGDHEANAETHYNEYGGQISRYGPKHQYSSRAKATNVLFASGDITVRGADPLASANDALAQGRLTQYEVCGSADCVDGLGLAMDDSNYGPDRAQLVILAGGRVDIRPKDEEEVDGPLQYFGEPLDKVADVPGDLPLRFAPNGDMLVATGYGVTQAPPIQATDFDLTAALLSGADPSTLFPATAAGPGSQSSLASGQDSLTMQAPDFCDQIVSGSCFGQ